MKINIGFESSDLPGLVSSAHTLQKSGQSPGMYLPTPENSGIKF